jgi:hypothetical protein
MKDRIVDYGIIGAGWVVAVFLAIVWVVAARGRTSTSLLSSLLDWLAVTALTVLIGGGILMFGVVLLVFFVGKSAATVGFGVAWAVIIVSPFAVAFMQYRGRRNRRAGTG